jgi:hypothetical protein
LKARAEPVVVRAVAELAITARSCAWETPTLEATVGGREGGGAGEQEGRVKRGQGVRGVWLWESNSKACWGSGINTTACRAAGETAAHDSNNPQQKHRLQQQQVGRGVGIITHLRRTQRYVR